MAPLTKILFELFLMFLAAKLAAEIFERLKLPDVIGELIAGIVIGSYALGLVGRSQVYDVIAQIGVIVLLFSVGLETKIEEIFRVGSSSILVATLGVIFPFVLGFGLIFLLGHSSIEAMFIGTAMSATSVGITARVLSDLNLLARKYSRVILGAAVVDDILALLLLVVVSGLGKGSLSLVNLALIVVEVLAFLFITLFVVRRIAKRKAASVLKKLNISNAPFATAVVVSLGLSAVASYIGMAAIIGAFLAGVVFAETEDKFALQREIAPVYAFLVPFFFVVMGTKVDIKQFVNPTVIWLMLIVTLLAVISKLFGGLLGSVSLGWKSALNVGIGMIPRGEVGLIVASIGLNLGKVPLNMYSVVVSMSVITTLLVPPILKLTTRDQLRLDG